jgi:hypothetical protein
MRLLGCRTWPLYVQCHLPYLDCDMGDAQAPASAAGRLKRTFRALDAFPKVEDEYQTRSLTGALGACLACTHARARHTRTRVLTPAQ